MARKSKKEDKFDFNSIISGFLKDFFFNTIKERIMEIIDDARISLNNALIDLSKTIGKALITGVFFLLGVIFLLFSFLFLTKEYFELSTGWTLLIWSFILLGVGLIFSFFAFKKTNED